LLNFVKKILKKNFFIYFIYRFLKEKIFLFFYRRLINFISYNKFSYKEDEYFKSNPKEVEKIILYGKEFFYPKYSLFYKKYFESFETEKKLDAEYNLIAKEFFEKEIECILDVGANIGYQSSFYNKFFGNKIQIHCFEPHSIIYYFLEKKFE